MVTNCLIGNQQNSGNVFGSPPLIIEENGLYAITYPPIAFPPRCRSLSSCRSESVKKFTLLLCSQGKFSCTKILNHQGYKKIIFNLHILFCFKLITLSIN